MKTIVIAAAIFFASLGIASAQKAPTKATDKTVKTPEKKETKMTKPADKKADKKDDKNPNDRIKKRWYA